MERAQAGAGWLLMTALVVAVSHWLGKDLNWDFLNYHLYGPYLMLGHRLEKDYFAASLQSYLNPLAYVPQYLMIRAGWSSTWIGAILAATHALNLCFVWLIARQVLPAPAGRRIGLPVLAVVLGYLAPLFLTTAGSSFSDPTTSVPVLAAACLLLQPTEQQRRPWATVAGAGLLLGLATGLKITNAVLTVGIVVPVALHWVLARQPGRLVRLCALLLACVTGFVLAHGYWSLQLWRTFGNPFFPLFNSLFQAPDFPPITYRDTRFLGDGWLGLLMLPFRMMQPISWLYSENVAVDLRFAVLALVLPLGLATLLIRHRQGGPGGAAAAWAAHRPLVLLTGMFISTYLVWGLTSRIGRYALPLWLLLGPLIAAWAQVLCRRTDRAALLCAVTIAAQIYALVLAGNPRWSPAKWESTWLDVDVPAELQQGPTTLLTLSTQTFSAAVPFLHPDARVVNMVGQYVQPASKVMTDRMRQLLATPTQNIRVVFRDRNTELEYRPQLLPSTRADVSAILSVYGLGLAPQDCEPIVIHAPYIQPGAAPDVPAAPPRLIGDRLQVCRVTRLDAAEFASVLAAQARVAQAFDAIEHACGAQLSPHGTQPIHGGHGWMRQYFNYLHSLQTDGEQVWIRPFRAMVDVDLGRLQRWTEPVTPTCPVLPAAIKLLD